MSGRTKLVCTYSKLSGKHIQQIQMTSSNIAVELIADDEGEIPRKTRDSEILLHWFNRFSSPLNKKILLSSKHLRWVHEVSAGVEGYLFPEFINSKITLTNSSGLHKGSVSEMAIGMMLAMEKRLNKFMRSQLNKEWTNLVPGELRGKTVGILGLGNIGLETARKAKCLGMKVIALKRKPAEKPQYVDRVSKPDDLNNFLGDLDYLIITVPLTKETYHLIGKKELENMKPTAFLINVARGPIVNGEALIEALKKGVIAGAGLDVFETEPLPKNSELWKMENVVITPHISGLTPGYEDKVVSLFCNNLRRYLTGKPLINVVDKRAGY